MAWEVGFTGTNIFGKKMNSCVVFTHGPNGEIKLLTEALKVAKLMIKQSGLTDCSNFKVSKDGKVMENILETL